MEVDRLPGEEFTSETFALSPKVAEQILNSYLKMTVKLLKSDN